MSQYKYALFLAMTVYNGQWINLNPVMRSVNESNTEHVYIWMGVCEEFATEGK